MKSVKGKLKGKTDKKGKEKPLKALCFKGFTMAES